MTITGSRNAGQQGGHGPEYRARSSIQAMASIVVTDQVMTRRKEAIISAQVGLDHHLVELRVQHTTYAHSSRSHHRLHIDLVAQQLLVALVAQMLEGK